MRQANWGLTGGSLHSTLKKERGPVDVAVILPLSGLPSRLVPRDIRMMAEMWTAASLSWQRWVLRIRPCLEAPQKMPEGDI